MEQQQAPVDVRKSVEANLIQFAVKTQTIRNKQFEMETQIMMNTPVEILEKQDAIRKEYEKLLADLQNELDQISITIRDLILQMKEKVKVEGVAQAIYVKPSAKWNNEKLEGLMMAFPQLEQAREWGNPSVRIQIEK